MQPLSRVKPNAMVAFNNPDTMSVRPQIAIIIAQCIADWSEAEHQLGMLLSFLLETDAGSIAAMYAAIDNRAAQLRMVEAAATHKLAPPHAEVLQAIILDVARPAMKQRDRFAHWGWGYSPDLEEALLIIDPQTNLAVMTKMFGLDRTRNFDPMQRDHIFVVTKKDAERALAEVVLAKDFIGRFIATMTSTPAPKRVENLQRLLNEPRVQRALVRHRKGRRSTPQVSPPLPQAESHG